MLEYAARLPGGDLDSPSFQQELATLPGDYSPPSGALFVAFDGRAALGCAALRSLDAATGEVKRLFVKPAARGRGIGRRLMTAVIRRARRIGFSVLRLDTDFTMHEAKRLYRSLGFVPIAAYHRDSTGRLEFMEMRLAPRSDSALP